MKEKVVKHKHFRFRDFLIVVICLSITAYSLNLFRLDLFQTISLQNVEPVGTIIIRDNIVQRRIADRVLWDRLSEASPVYLGDLIRVAELSAATLNIEGQQIDLEENTLIRIQLSPDDGALQIELSEGGIGIITSADGGGLQLSSQGKVIEMGAGAVIAASSGPKGIAVQVNEGRAVLGDREITTGTKVAFDDTGAQLELPSVVVMSPQPNARYVKGQRSLPVVFTWNRINLRANDRLRLEIASDRNFNRIAHGIDNLNNRAEASLEAGVWNWRVLYQNTTLSSGRVTVVEGALEMLSPVRGSMIRYQDELPSLRFQWSGVEEASQYLIEISPTADFSNPHISRQIGSTFFTHSNLGKGTWHWRVKPVYSTAFEGGSDFSQASFFTIEQGSEEVAIVLPEVAQMETVEEIELPPPPPLPIPGNRVPANGHRVGIEQFRAQRNIAFRWAAVREANAYILTLFETTADGRRQIYRTTVTNTNYVLGNIDVLKHGHFIWQIEAVNRDRNGNIVRRGTVGENTFTMDIPAPRPVQMESPGILYGF